MNYCVGYLSVEGEEHRIPDSEIIHPRDDLAHLVWFHNVDEIVVALNERRNRLPIQDLLECRIKGIKVSHVSSFLNAKKVASTIKDFIPVG